MRPAGPFLLVGAAVLLVAWPILASEHDGARWPRWGHHQGCANKSGGGPKQEVTLPLRGSAVGTYAGNSPELLTVEGVATAVGPFEAWGDVVRDAADPFAVSGTFTLSCHTGELNGTYQGWYDIPQPFAGIIPVGANFLITGGTERFEDASGSGDVEGRVELTGQGAVLKVRLRGTVTMNVPQGQGHSDH